MKESTLRMVNYGAILALLVTLSVHLWIHGFFGTGTYVQQLSYGDVIGRYQDLAGSATLAILLVAAGFHGLLGLRNILLEMRTGPVWDRTVTYGVIAMGAVLIAWGFRTLVLAAGA